jgi:hypothetical protein
MDSMLPLLLMNNNDDDNNMLPLMLMGGGFGAGTGGMGMSSMLPLLLMNNNDDDNNMLPLLMMSGGMGGGMGGGMDSMLPLLLMNNNDDDNNMLPLLMMGGGLFGGSKAPVNQPQYAPQYGQQMPQQQFYGGYQQPMVSNVAYNNVAAAPVMNNGAFGYTPRVMAQGAPAQTTFAAAAPAVSYAMAPGATAYPQVSQTMSYAAPVQNVYSGNTGYTSAGISAPVYSYNSAPAQGFYGAAPAQGFYGAAPAAGYGYVPGQVIHSGYSTGAVSGFGGGAVNGFYRSNELQEDFITQYVGAKNVLDMPKYMKKWTGTPHGLFKRATRASSESI